MRRTYKSPVRQAKAAQTRASIVEAARLLFDQHGYAATTLDMIAQQSNTSPNTVYVIFHTKTAILHAILRQVDPEAVMAAAVATAMAQGDPRRQLRILVDRYVALNSSDDGVFSIASNAALTDLDAAIWWESAQNSEWHDLRTFASRWERGGCLKQNLSAQDATNSLWAMTRPSLIRSFIHDCGWSAEHCAQWLASTLDHAIFDGNDLPMLTAQTRAAQSKTAKRPAEAGRLSRSAPKEDLRDAIETRQS